MNKIGLKTIILRNPEIMHNDIDGEAVMMSIEQNSFYGIDEIGTQIWNFLENPTTPEKIITEMMQHYNVEREKCESDLMNFLNEILNNKLILINDKI